MRKPFASYTVAVDFDSGRIDPARWRVAITGEKGRDHVLSSKKDNRDFYFASRRDAELAAKALNDAGLDTAEKLIEAGWEKVREVMTSALMW